jgi:hypothetical protein
LGKAAAEEAASAARREDHLLQAIEEEFIGLDDAFSGA